jgi:diguanylate cyclase (GGDEF)-like protein
MNLLSRIDQALGLTGANRRLRLLYAWVILAGGVVALAGPTLPGTPPLHGADWIQLAGAVGAATLAQLARVRIRVGTSQISLGWGEAALIIVIYLIPLGWVPAAVLVGVVLAQLVLRFFGELRTPVSLAYNAAILALASAAAAGVAVLVNPDFHQIENLSIAKALIPAAITYTAVNLALFALVMSLRTGAPFGELMRRTISGKLSVIGSNIAVGLLIVITSDENPRWLIILPPVLWLLRQAYANRLRADDERRAWEMFSRSTEALNQLDEKGVAEAGVRGATLLFPTGVAEVRVLRPDGVTWGYRGGVDATVLNEAALDMPAGKLAITRPLKVGSTPVGELRLHFQGPVELTARETMQLSAFSDALAAALHDAASHRELQALLARSLHAAAHDPLTGLSNRDTLLTKGNGALRMLDRDTPVALLLLDMDHFKEVNDTLGHAAGDRLLRVLAARIGGFARGGELVARLSGDEFAVLVTGLHGPAPVDEAVPGSAEALRRARELAELVAMPTEVVGVPLAIEASIGVVVAPAGSVDMTELLRRADIAMYQAKRGGSAVGWYDGSGDEGSTDRLALLAELREALTCSNQLVLAYQPELNLRTYGPTGVEALIRWQHPRRGELVPRQFLSVLEHSDLVGPFTRYVLDQALATAASWQAQGVDIPVSVNVSPRSLLDPELPGQVEVLLHKYGVPPHKLIMEITETVVVPEHHTVTTVLDGLVKLGVQLSVDDFGTGYSSLKFLTRVRVDEVKVDRSFVSRMVESAETLAIIRITVDLAAQLGVRVVAEGVETAEQRAALAELGCTSAQGHLFFAALPADRITGTLVELARNAGGKVIPFRTEDAS